MDKIKTILSRPQVGDFPISVVVMAVIMLAFFHPYKVQGAAPDDEAVYNYEEVEQKPIFPGGENALYSFFAENYVNPSLADDVEPVSRLVVRFIIDKEGFVREACIVRSLGPAYDREALRVVNAMPRWNPGLNNGHPVRVSYTLPITFRLSTGE